MGEVAQDEMEIMKVPNFHEMDAGEIYDLMTTSNRPRWTKHLGKQFGIILNQCMMVEMQKFLPKNLTKLAKKVDDICITLHFNLIIYFYNYIRFVIISCFTPSVGR